MDGGQAAQSKRTSRMPQVSPIPSHTRQTCHSSRELTRRTQPLLHRHPPRHASLPLHRPFRPLNPGRPARKVPHSSSTNALIAPIRITCAARRIDVDDALSERGRPIPVNATTTRLFRPAGPPWTCEVWPRFRSDSASTLDPVRYRTDFKLGCGWFTPLPTVRNGGAPTSYSEPALTRGFLHSRPWPHPHAGTWYEAALGLSRQPNTATVQAGCSKPTPPQARLPTARLARSTSSSSSFDRDIAPAKA